MDDPNPYRPTEATPEVASGKPVKGNRWAFLVLLFLGSFVTGGVLAALLFVFWAYWG